MIKYEVVIPRTSKTRAENTLRLLKARGFNAEIRTIDDYADIYCDTVFEALTEYRRRTGVGFVQAVDWIRTHPEAWKKGGV